MRGTATKAVPPVEVDVELTFDTSGLSGIGAIVSRFFAAAIEVG